MLRRPGPWFAGATALLCAPILAALPPSVAAASGPSVSVTSTSWWTDPVGSTTYLHLVGEVLNSGDAASNVSVTLTLLAADGHQVGTATVPSTISLMGQGERSPFEEIMPEPAGYDRFSASVSATNATATTAHQFTFTLDACPNMDPTSAACQALVPQGQISGTVRNDTGLSVDNVAAAFTFLDANGNAVAQNTAMVANGLVLAPGSSGDFVINRAGEPAWTSMRFLAEPDYPVDLNPSSIDFGNQLVLARSAAASVTVFNRGTRTVNIGAVTVTGDFSRDTACGVLAPQSSCIVDVSFTPTSRGLHTGTLTIPDDAAGTPQQIPLLGTGIAPIATLSTNQLNFGPVSLGASATLPLTLSNTGDAPLAINTIGISGDYVFDARACPSTLDPRTNCVIDVTFKPSRPYDRPGTLVINDSDPLHNPQQVGLDGSGQGASVSLNATAVAFGNQSLGVSKDQQVTVTNTGNVNLGIQSITPPAGIGEKDTCAAPVAPNGQCTVTLTFAPTQAGAVNGNVVFTDNASDSPQSLPVSGNGVTPLTLDPTALSFGTTLLGGSSDTKTVTLTNTGSVPIDIASAMITAGPFEKTATTCANALAVAAQCSISVRFVPSQAGAQNGTLTLADSAAGSPHRVGLSGTGVAPRWQSLGGVIPGGAAATSWGPSRIDVFVRGSDQFLWHQSFDGTSWSNWERLGGPIASEPAAVSWAAGHIDVFLKGTDGHPWQATYDAGKWSWIQMDGLLGSTPTVVSWAPGHLDLFTRGTDGQMWQNTFDSGRWFDWQPLGGVLDTEPAAVTPAVGVIDVFVKGTDNRLWQDDFSNGAWHNWQPFSDGVLASVPAGASPAPGRIDLFVRGTDSRLWHKTYANGQWQNWTDADDLGGIITAKPGAAARGTTLEVFARGSDSALWWLELGTR